MKEIIVMAAQDVAPSQVLKLLAEEILRRTQNFSVHRLLAFGGDQTPNVDNIVSVTDLVTGANSVIVGMSSSLKLAEKELEAAEQALAIGIPVYCYVDTFGLRPYFSKILSSRLTTLFCISERQAEQARREYPDLNVVVTGNPMWEEFFTPELTREQSREKLGIGLDETVILCPGGKVAAVNIVHFNTVIEGCTGDKEYYVVISLHPGDNTPRNIYETLVDFAPDNVKVRIVPRNEMSASEILSGSDAVVSSASTIEVEALCREVPIPVFSFLSPLAKRRLKRVTGSDEWELVKMEVVYEYDHVTRLNLLGSIKDWMNSGEDSMEVNKIRKHFPKPEKIGSSLEKMMDAIFA